MERHRLATCVGCLASGLAVALLSPDALAWDDQLGTVAQECQYPTVGRLTSGNGQCTGTYIGDRTVITAAHCGAPTSFFLGENAGSNQPDAIDIDFCVKNVNYVYPMVNGKDVMVCRLMEDPPNVPVIPPAIPSDCAADGMRWLMYTAYNPCVLNTNPQVSSFCPTDHLDGEGAGRGEPDSIMRFADVDVISQGPCSAPDVCPQAIVTSYEGQRSGDSGGPLFYQMPDGGYRVIGVLSGGSQISKKYGDVPSGLASLEYVMSVDVTPCHDYNGTTHSWEWVGGCSIPTNPKKLGNSWDYNCKNFSPDYVPNPTECSGFSGPFTGAPHWLSAGDTDMGDTGWAPYAQLDDVVQEAEILYPGPRGAVSRYYYIMNAAREFESHIFLSYGRMCDFYPVQWAAFASYTGQGPEWGYLMLDPEIQEMLPPDGNCSGPPV